MNLFQVQDSDRPMWVVAESYGHAVKRWREQIAKENPTDDCSGEEPDGVNLIASGTDLNKMPEILLPTTSDIKREKDQAYWDKKYA